ncbi:HpcH/HpaI aldolase family protein [Ilumatobacter nonamiensis]|uniref:HpcH/HpaI aldolase family protein n=1 Tax=Ilumatobacter nonamiensis TaxID=467093 RepID=UPI000348E526|nr:aldolase/citrate lyase family protein [Ilumatobacter nonamiensis]
MTLLTDTWERGDAALGAWLSGDSPAAAEVVGAAGFDYVNIDMQHGLADYSRVVEMMRALQSSPATITCRVPWNEQGIIGRVLDAGAMGVIIPMVNTVEQARRAVEACRYAPDGARSYGPIRAGQVNGPDYQATANDRVACIPMIETAEAVENLDDILDVDGIDAVYVGPADLSLTLGLPPRGDHDDESFNTALAAIVEACNRRGVVAGIHANPQLVAKRLEQGFRMVTATADLLAMADGLDRALAAGRSPSEPAAGEPSIY